KRVNSQRSFSVGGPSRPSNQSHNSGRQGNGPYDRPQINRESNRSANQVTRGNQVREKQACFRCGEVGHYANECGAQDPLCYNCKKTGHYVRDCKAPRAAPSVNANQGARPTATGRVYYMGTGVSGQARNANHEDGQIAGRCASRVSEPGGVRRRLYERWVP
ncbi:putative TIR-NBS-LRR resistance protein, partial [Trifolium pratense]